MPLTLDAALEAPADISRNVVRGLDPSRMTPHGDRYLVEKLSAQGSFTVTDDVTGEITGIIHFPQEYAGREEADNGYYIARVLAAGNGMRHETGVIVPMTFDAGDVVMVEKFSGREIKLGTRTYCVVSQVDVLLRLDELSP
jgi:co-chaperonin GroES (HSP10)